MKNRFTQEQIAFALRQAEGRMAVSDAGEVLSKPQGQVQSGPSGRGGRGREVVREIPMGTTERVRPACHGRTRKAEAWESLGLTETVG
ncbi:MAG TPA: hypothetical protein VNA25_16330 [Phycisphaerae bacterium]|nr:hypothetical protein [Phycisphaerae bacterium]